MLSRSASSYGYNGYEAGHAERRVAEEALQHFKAVSERLRTDFERGSWERLIVGCHDVNWPEFEPHLHPYVKQRLIGRFSADVASVSNEEIRDHANASSINGSRNAPRRKSAKRWSSPRPTDAGSPACAAYCKRWKPGKCRAIFLTENYSARAVECPHCGHLDAHLVAHVSLADAALDELADVCDAIIPIAIRRNIELFYLKENEELDRAGNIAALLRFRSDQKTDGVRSRRRRSRGRTVSFRSNGYFCSLTLALLHPLTLAVNFSR